MGLFINATGIDIEDDVTECELGQFDIITCFDMLEHLKPLDLYNVLDKLAKATNKYLIINLRK